jgi:Zn-dependent protease with chaperone function
MQFKVPKFLERESPIIGPLIFKQFLYFGIAALILAYIHFVAPFYIFLICLILLVGLATSLAFVKIEGVPLPEVISQSFGFTFSSKMYLWQKKESLKPIKIVPRKKEQKEKEISLRVSPKSSLRQLYSRIRGNY